MIILDIFVPYQFNEMISVKQPHIRMRLDYDDYSKGCCKALYNLIALGLDFALMPYCLYLTWNYCVPDLFGLPKISFYHVILFKLCILFFIPSTFCATFEYSHNDNKHRYYINAIYDELQSLNINQELWYKKLQANLRTSEMTPSSSHLHSQSNQNHSAYYGKKCNEFTTILPYNSYDVYTPNDNNV